MNHKLSVTLSFLLIHDCRNVRIFEINEHENKIVQSTRIGFSKVYPIGWKISFVILEKKIQCKNQIFIACEPKNSKTGLSRFFFLKRNNNPKINIGAVM